VSPKPREDWVQVRYIGGKEASFRVRGRLTRTLYDVSGRGFTFWADPQDVRGCKGKKGFDGSEYEVVR